MGIKDFFKGKKQNEAELPALPKPEIVIDFVTTEDGEEAKKSALRKTSKAMVGQFAMAADRLLPMATAAADTAKQYGMAIVKFPEGVGWNDLCIRHKDGWNLLSSLKDGKFNEMAAIKQAGLQPAAVANLALQGAAVAVGMAYMNKISDQLDGIKDGIDQILQEMQAQRDAKLKASFDMLNRYALRYEEYLANGNTDIAMIGIQDALHDAREIWNYELNAAANLCDRIKREKKIKEDGLTAYSQELHQIEERAAVTARLYAAASQLAMQYDSDFSESRIAHERMELTNMLNEFRNVKGPIILSLDKHVSKLGGAPLVLAPKKEGTYTENSAFNKARHALEAEISRINPLEMRRAAINNREDKKNALLCDISGSNDVANITRAQIDTLEELDFMFNHANAMLFENGKVTLIAQDIKNFPEVG